MSTLKVATIQDTSGNNSSTPSQVAQGRAKAWVNFNGTGTVAIRDDFNVSSITDNGTGNYTVNLTSAMSRTNYAVVAFLNMSDNVDSANIQCALGNQTSRVLTTSSFPITVANTANLGNSASFQRDTTVICAAVFGD